MTSIDQVTSRECRKRGKGPRTTIALVLLIALTLMVPMMPAEVEGALGKSVRIIDPNGGEDLVGATIMELRFTTSESGGVVLFYLSTDGGATFPIDVGSKNNTGGSQIFDWLVPNNVNTTTARLKAEWRSQSAIPFVVLDNDTCDADFTITPGIDLRFTQVESEMSYGRYYLLKWALYDSLDKLTVVDLQARYQVNGSWSGWTTLSGKYSNIDPEETGIWFMPDYYETANGQLKVRGWTEKPSGTILAEAESEVFSIDSPWIELLTPNGGEVLVGGDTCTITWATANDPDDIIIGVAIDYSTNSGSSWIGITGSAPNSFTYDWTVPILVNYDHVRVRVSAQYGEWQTLASDASDGDCRIIADEGTVTVSIVSPNPHSYGSEVVQGGETYAIQWSSTGDHDDYVMMHIALSTNNGSNYVTILNVTAAHNYAYWQVPEIECYGARLRLTLEHTGGEATCRNVNSFFIFTNTVYNQPPLAVVGNGQSVLEGTTVTLDGSGSYDPNGDPLTYEWQQVDGIGFDVTLSNDNVASPTFVPNILDYPVTMIFELKVSDGQDLPYHYVDHLARTSVLVTPSGPTITGFTPDGGWEGGWVKITGTNLMGGQVRIGGVLTATVPTSPSPRNPAPDQEYNFTLVPGIPTVPAPITVTTSMGTATSTEDFDVYPRPWYCLDHGFYGWDPANPNKDYLSYPWSVLDEGNYHDTFGNDVYLNLWICLGIPYWTPWDGWECLGYEIEQPLCADPLAALYYGCAYCHLAQNGECFGASAVSLQFYREMLETEDIQAGCYDVDDLTFTGELKRRIEYMHGSQVSAECLHAFIGEHLSNLMPSAYGVSGMGLVLSGVQDSIDSGELGLLSIVDGTKGHIVIPYEIVDVDATHTRIYVWDINLDMWADEEEARSWCNSTDVHYNHPPYVEVDKSGLYWEWSYYMGEWWGGNMGMTFLPIDVALGDRSLPTTLDGALDLVFGCASSSVEDDQGRELAILDNGSFLMEIPDASPFWYYQDGASPYGAFYLPSGNYTTHIKGEEVGLYNWTYFTDEKAAYGIVDVEGGPDTEDTIMITERMGNPFMGVMNFTTSDEEKTYSATQIKKFDSRERVYKLINATIFDDSEAVINTTDDYNSLVFFNNGPHTITFDVEFQGNVLSEETWNEVNGTLTGLPTAKRTGITIGPYQTLIIHPSDWLNLLDATVVVEGEMTETTEDEEDWSSWLLPLAIVIGAIVVVVAAVVLIRRHRKGGQRP